MGDDAPKMQDADHPYYASHGNYYRGGDACYAEYWSWGEFYAVEGEGDIDLNLVYRWDWTGNALEVFFIGQRKALHRSVRVAVTPEDEPRIRAWLEPRWQRLREMWSPISEGK